MNKPREYMGYLAYLAQEIVLDAATPGRVAADRLVTNAKLLQDTVHSWASYCNWDMRELMKETLNGKEVHEHYQDRIRKATGRKAR